MVDIFISYSRKDREAVARLAQAVTAAGYDVWWDKELPPHKNYGDVITEKISEAEATIVVWSQDSVKSEWVRAEADFARGQKKLVQTALDETAPPMPFNQIQYAQLGDWRGEDDHGGWTKVRASLAELCGTQHREPPRPSPLPPPRPTASASTASRWPLWAGGGMLALAAIVVVATQYRGPTTTSPPAAPVAQTAPTPAPQVAPVQTATAMAPAPLPAAPPAGPTPRATTAANTTPAVATNPAVTPPGPAPVAVTTANPAPVSAPVPTPAVTPIVAGRKPPPQVFSLSSARQLNPRQFDNLSLEQLYLARNEIFAHAGRRFRDPNLLAYFSQYHWYQPQSFEVTLNPFEAHNMKLLNAAIAARK